jgi:diadenosine tetraphosphate (Ap4A) HIT family hydrolase
MIHDQLLKDCHVLGRFERCSVLLNRNASIPWFILVPDTDRQDLLDLEPEELAGVTEECQRVSRFLKRDLGYDKVNFAGLGNVVPQMHLHVIARSPEDACWPRPVWGEPGDPVPYASELVSEWRDRLVSEYGLHLDGEGAC